MRLQQRAGFINRGLNDAVGVRRADADPAQLTARLRHAQRYF